MSEGCSNTQRKSAVKMKERNNFGKFVLLWSGELISSIGGGLTSFGLGVYIFAQTGSAAGMALVSHVLGAATIPLVLYLFTYLAL